MRRFKIVILLIICTLAFKSNNLAQESVFSEQVIGSSTFKFDDPFLTLAGIRYIPDYKSSTNLKDNLFLKTNISLNIFGNALLYDLDRFPPARSSIALFISCTVVSSSNSNNGLPLSEYPTNLLFAKTAILSSGESFNNSGVSVEKSA